MHAAARREVKKLSVSFQRRQSFRPALYKVFLWANNEQIWKIKETKQFLLYVDIIHA